MQQLNTLTDDADQVLTMSLPDGSVLKMEFIYRAGVQRWVVNISHPLLALNGFNLALGPNVLRAWRNLISFGMLITAVDQVDPVQISDFLTGRVGVYILTADEVAQVESELYAPTPLVNA